MKNRTRDYYRDMRRRKIWHRKYICQVAYGFDWYQDCDGMYSKGKIHCSCPMCANNRKHLGLSHRDLKLLQGCENYEE